MSDNYVSQIVMSINGVDYEVKSIEDTLKTGRTTVKTFGYQELVLPVDKGLALVGLLKDAVPVGYGGAGMYVPKLEELELSLEVLKPGQFAPAKLTLH